MVRIYDELGSAGWHAILLRRRQAREIAKIPRPRLTISHTAAHIRNGTKEIDAFREHGFAF
jgi:hypothetical protein